ncbi:hypothetical protein FPSE5266_04025 [Fusarium pseudograminearum]|nr:hypothetical protein FPSE5266_04025 [Fusarium pseudograminearum]
MTVITTLALTPGNPLTALRNVTSSPLSAIRTNSKPSNIQGFTCRSPVNLWLYLDDERQQFSGPTEGKIKINPRRISKYKIVRR